MLSDGLWNTETIKDGRLHNASVVWSEAEREMTPVLLLTSDDEVH